MLGSLAHGSENRGVIEHKHAGISHEKLETGNAFADKLAHFLELCGTKVSDDAVEGIVGHRFALGFLHPGVESLAQALPLVLNGKIDERGGTAKRRRDGAGLEIVGARGSAEGHVEVRVHVDPAGKHEVIGGVEYVAGVFDGQPCADGGDLVANDADVSDGGVGCGHYRAVPNYRIKAHFNGLDLNRGFRNSMLVVRKDVAAVDFQGFFFLAAHQVDVELRYAHFPQRL